MEDGRFDVELKRIVDGGIKDNTKREKKEIKRKEGWVAALTNNGKQATSQLRSRTSSRCAGHNAQAHSIAWGQCLGCTLARHPTVPRASNEAAPRRCI